MPRIPNNLRERAMAMLDAGMSTEYVARHVGCSSRAIPNIRVIFRTTGSTNDSPRRGRPCVTTLSQDSYIMNTHLRNLFQTATATVYGITVSMHGVLTSDARYRNVIVNIVLIRHVYTLVGYGDAGIPFFFRIIDKIILFNYSTTILSIKISYFRICFCTFDLSCSILEKDNCIEHFYIVLSYLSQ